MMKCFTLATLLCLIIYSPSVARSRLTQAIVDSQESGEVDLTIIVPCYNEESKVAATLDTISSAMRELPDYSCEVLVVDDGSTDNTVRVVTDYQASHSDLPIVLRINPKNRGLTRTYVDGAFVGRGKYYRLVCGDNVEPKETLIKVFSQIGKADIVI